MSSEDTVEAINNTEIWRELKQHCESIKQTNLKTLFEESDRNETFNLKADNLIFDYSKNLVNSETISLLKKLATKADLKLHIQNMFNGDVINTTEERSVLHTALRAPKGRAIKINGKDIVPDIHEVLDRMKEFSSKIRQGKLLGSTGKPINSIVNIGIGGSDLGPAMAYRALNHFKSPNIECRFVSNVDPTAIIECIEKLDPETTLFIIASKTFTTIETISNANAAKAWVKKALGEHAISSHFAAISTNEKNVNEFGIKSKNMFGFWEWVGGRYSVASAIGLSVMIAIGPEQFDNFLAGMHKMDQHFLNTPVEENIPALMGMIGIWNRNFLGYSSHAVLPYSQNLELFPVYLQQLDMESNGKSITKEDQHVSYQTGPVIWGAPGTNGQHAFFQLLHQGTETIPSDFIGFCKPPRNASNNQHDLLISNLLAQTHSLAFGKHNTNNHRNFEGNRPTTTILFNELSPFTLGQLIAMYEHKVFTMGCIWGINSFDQFGVELGKEMATDIMPTLESDIKPDYDSSTNNLINYYKENR